ncbi:MAG: 2-hydroxyacid dehydrogenase [Burkholderiales bacterium]
MKPRLLILNPNAPAALEMIAQHFDLLHAPDAARRAAAIAAHAGEFRAVLTIGSIGLTAAEIDAMPKLELVCVLGAGYENVDVAHAKARGIVVANGAGANADCVADHAMALLLAVVRGVAPFDRACRAGVWRSELPMRPNVSHRRLGIVGFGAIGQRLARRAAGFEMQIGWHGRTRRDDVPYPWFDSVTALAAWCDFLIVATPGGPGTQHLIDAGVLNALGPDGFLVNIARGSVVDTAALAEALRNGRIQGAGLDVYEGEPEPPAMLIGLDNVLLTPHTGGASPQALEATLTRFLENATRHFAGLPVISPL